MTKGYIKFVFAIFLILGLYLVNFALEFIAIPSFIASHQSWIFSIAGILLVFTGFGFLKQYKNVV